MSDLSLELKQPLTTTDMHTLLLAQAETYQPGPGEVAAAGGVTIVYLIVLVVLIAALWKIFTKAGKPGWAAIVPIYNGIVLLEIIGRPLWWIVLLLIPFVNIVIAFITSLDLAKSFGKGTGFGLGLIFLGPIFLPILGFGSARYQGPSAAQS
jgi:hypothetical protein